MILLYFFSLLFFYFISSPRDIIFFITKKDRRLNIWNLQSGKHMRAYKNDAVTGELYKSDVDPSGASLWYYNQQIE